ncbi:hypothetical protein MMC22_010220 [Lobaria immixta]|nr:hypothetical protein [Lobaria immixta]
MSLVTGISFAGQVLSYYSDTVYKHVAVFSIDGLHSSDVEKYVSLRPGSTIANLLGTGFEYTNAYTSGPSDSFPGTLNQFTGASPRTTGIWYDDTYDRSFFDAGSGCKGPPGAEVQYAENLDYDPTKLFSGGINETNLPLALLHGKCTPVYPHQRLRVNTVFEVIKNKGKETAYCDKHPAYDLVRGPSGKGLSEGYFPEIASAANNVDSIITYDQLHVDAFLDWLDGKSPPSAEGTLSGVPTLFGGNFQSVNVGQKTKGYQNAPGNPFTTELLKALDFVDASLGKFVQKLTSVGLLDSTLIIVASKHGQAPINPTLYKGIDPLTVTNSTEVDVAFQTSDDIALLFLKNQDDTEKAVRNLNQNREKAAIQDIISGQRQTYLGYGDPKTDPAVPDIIVRPDLGVCYSLSQKKIAEHGGLSDDDRKVACFVSNPKLKKTKYHHRVSTKQVAPTILKALGYNPGELQGVVAEKTRLLDGF